MATPLKKAYSNGSIYARRSEVEQLIDEIEALPINAQTERCTKSKVPMEVLLYFLRKTKAEDHTKAMEPLYLAFYTRAEASIKASIRRYKLAKEDFIVQETLDRLTGKLMEDAPDNSVLDYFEVRFNQALTRLRNTVLEAYGPNSKKDPLADASELTTSSEDSAELSLEIENAAAAFFDPDSSILDDENFRLSLMAAINNLPDNLRRPVQLRLQGMQIESNDPKTSTIPLVLDCTDRTVRNRLGKAYSLLREQLAEEMD